MRKWQTLNNFSTAWGSQDISNSKTMVVVLNDTVTYGLLRFLAAKSIFACKSKTAAAYKRNFVETFDWWRHFLS
jgi:hypothetical protein